MTPGTVLLTLPFGGAVLRSLGSPAEEVNYILAEKRREVLSGKELERFEEETVLAQLGVEKPEGKDEEGAGAVAEGAPAPAADPAADQEPRGGAAEVPALNGDAPASEAREAAKPKEPEALKPLVKRVVEANVSLEPKKKEVEAEPAEADSEPETERRDQGTEPS